MGDTRIKERKIWKKNNHMGETGKTEKGKMRERERCEKEGNGKQREDEQEKNDECEDGETGKRNRKERQR